MDDRAERLRSALHAAGFDEVRFAAAGAVPAAPLEQWLAAGHHADMAWMERTRDKRLDLQKVLLGTRAVVLLGVSSAGAPDTRDGAPRWARYARHRDYHETIKPGLVQAGRALEHIYGLSADDYRYYTDTGPVLERGWAARSGIGFLGKNAMVISRRFGNWLLLSAILVRVDLPADPPVPGPAHNRHVAPPSKDGEGEPVGKLCGKCTRCLDACPTDAFAGPGRVDARRCISYQTIENRGAIPSELRVGIGDRVFGCDVCLEVCPWNRFARAGRRTLLAAHEAGASMNWEELLRLTPESFAAVFKGTPVKRLKLTGLLRNACVGAGNSGDRSLVPALLVLCRHESAIVRAHAVWAVRRLGGGAGAEGLRTARVAETDPAVLTEYGPPAATG